MSIEQTQSDRRRVSEEQQARIDLTAVLRWADRCALSEGICNHFSLQLPGATDQFLLNPQGVHWSELRAKDLIVVDSDGNVISGHYTAEPSAFFIHSSVHRSRRDACCVLHAHPPYCTALSCLEDGRLEWCSQNSLRFYGRVAYDETFNGAAFDETEGDRICAQLADADILFMANHGVMITGKNVAEAFDDLYYLERTAMNQILAQSSGQRLRLIPADVCRATRQQLASEPEQAHHFLAAIKRILTRESPEFADCEP